MRASMATSCTFGYTTLRGIAYGYVESSCMHENRGAVRWQCSYRRQKLKGEITKGFDWLSKIDWTIQACKRQTKSAGVSCCFWKELYQVISPGSVHLLEG
jgi:hypothetical protein